MSHARRLPPDQQQHLIAYTDASVSEGGEASAAVVLMNLNRWDFNSVHLFHFGHGGVKNYKAEIDAKIAALHVAPAGTLRHVFSDSKGTVGKLNSLLQGLPDKNIHKHLDAEDIAFFEEGVERQPGVQFSFMSRQARQMRLVDKFSRFARNHEALYTHAQANPRLDVMRQREVLLETLRTPT